MAKVNLNETQTRKVLAERLAVTLYPLNPEVKYSGTGSINGHRFAYQIGNVTLTKTGELVGIETLTADQVSRLKDMAQECGYELEGIEEPNQDEGCEIRIPGMEPEEFQKLQAIIAAKHDLLCKALGKATTEPLKLNYREGEFVGFPWFTSVHIMEHGLDFAKLCCALCKLAKSVKRVTAKQHDVPNEKYAFRVFLLRIGFIGDQYASARKLLLSNLTGNGAWKNKKED